MHRNAMASTSHPAPGAAQILITVLCKLVGAESAHLVENSLLPLSWSLAAPPAKAGYAVNGIREANFYAPLLFRANSLWLSYCCMQWPGYSHPTPIRTDDISCEDESASNHPDHDPISYHASSDR